MTIKNRNEMQERSVAFLTLGCKVNSYETDGMEKLFQEAGYRITEFSEKASIYVINTCTVTNIADRKSRQMLHKAKKNNPDGIVVAVGCYAQASKETLEIDEAIDIVVGNNQKKNIVSIVENYMNDGSENEAVININQEQEYEELTIESVGEKTRAYIKIQDGCNQFCSYCIIPYARGRVRSRKAEDVIEEVVRVADKGYKEVVLTGIHLSSYGIDFRKQEAFAQIKIEDENITGVDYQANRKEYHNKELLQLIIDISNIDGVERIRLGSLEPRIITEEFAGSLAKNKKFCPHFHLSLQSGSNGTLKRMNRRYTAEEYYEKCELLRRHFENPAITTDVIVGFPGETKEEFDESKEFVKQVSFAQMHIFKYSKRKGTKAETMPDQVQESVKQERSNQLIEIGARLNKEYKQHFMDRIEKILVEEEIEIDGEKYQVGHNERYLKIAFSSKKNYVNEIVQGKITGDLTDEILFCKIID
ncbi:threonylcarbamoyladenosine tRNA methylthiotransferase MtaB [Mobilisporobacter senegalensis]|uniref:Threonylcarbamoyladenosine tRNA methylthiotransferase MtaB n=1 Tax=Mobilisporobacter senegalensis TaxID=1329262 RepID=A0A3N1XVH1_9FIRM|nr:MiaB/RimO family radical SAM methylthiotransferase [Mobilisporobacter senegalensis]ROR30620.1 threonylcarbamoyladenosine tRNA methylthiotransferase MtaB [Mobilisporobacter senegalensis]